MGKVLKRSTANNPLAHSALEIYQFNGEFLFKEIYWLRLNINLSELYDDNLNINTNIFLLDTILLYLFLLFYIFPHLIFLKWNLFIIPYKLDNQIKSY